MFTSAFWKDTGERILRTFAATLAALLGQQAAGLSIIDVDWTQALGVSALSGFLTLLTAVAASGVGSTRSASFLETGG